MANFKNELAAKLSAGPNLTLGLRRPAGMGPRLTSPVSPPTDQLPGPPVIMRSSRGSSLSGSSRESLDCIEPVDSYMDVAMQKIHLNRQRHHRIPTRYSNNAKVVPSASGGLNRIMEEVSASNSISIHFVEPDTIPEKKYSTPNSSSSAHFAHTNVVKHSSMSYTRNTCLVSNSSSDSENFEDDASNQKPSSIYSKSLPQYNEHELHVSASHSSGKSSATRSPFTSLSGEGLASPDNDVIESRYSHQSFSARPASMLVPGCLHDELQGIVRSRLSASPNRGDPSYQKKFIPQNQPDALSEKCTPLSKNSSSVFFENIHLRHRNAGHLPENSSLSESSSSQISPAIDMVADSAVHPPKVIDLIKAFQRGSP